MSIEHFAVSHYEKAAVVRRYATRSELLPPEEKLLEIYPADIAGRRILDLGCGAGRTTGRLHPLAQCYVGVDYSLKMIESCRRRYPTVDFVHGDATDLSKFDPASFDFVLFSYNGIDTMAHGNRLRVLGEVYRLLVPGGLFAFSSHNLQSHGMVVAFDRSLPFRPRTLQRHVRHLISYLMVRNRQVRTATYSILSDPLAGFKQLTYYIGKSDQLAQLEEMGFVNLAVLDTRGGLVPPDLTDRQSKWLHYVCRKPMRSGT